MKHADKLSQAARKLKAQGHTVEPRIMFGRVWCEIDRRMLASSQEMEKLADGVYSLSELEELYIRRRALEAQVGRRSD